MIINGLGSISGQGSVAIQAAAASGYTVSFSTYDSRLPATMSGTAPTIANQTAGATFTVPGAGTLLRSETPFQSSPVNIELLGWSDGSALYLPGSTYTMPSSNITFSAIWKHLYSPDITSISPTSLAIGGTLTIYGVGIGSAQTVKFWRNKFSTSITIISDYEIRAVMPETTTTGPVTLNMYGGGVAVSASLTKI